MKGCFLRLLFLLTLTILSVAPSHALLGVDDNVVGHNILVPFFLVSIDDNGMDTLIVITETGQGCWPGPSAICGFRWHMWNKTGHHLADNSLPMTRNDVTTMSVRDLIISSLSLDGIELLKIDLDGDGVPDHYAGYMTIEDRDTTAQNHFMAKAYLYNFVNGKSASFNLPVREVDESGLVTDSELIDISGRTEYFSANALFRAQQYIKLQGTSGSVFNAEYLRLTPRFRIANVNSSSYFFIWASSACPGLIVTLYDESGNAMSTNLPPLTHGLNIVNLWEWLPANFLTSFPTGGWVDIKMLGSDFDGNREMLGYIFTETAPSVCGDVSGEGQVNITDAMYIAQFLAGNRTCICDNTPREQCDPNTQSLTYSSGYISLTEMNQQVGTVN